MSTYDAVVGQPRLVEQLSRAAVHPVHAYLFVGPPGTGKRTAALAFAAHLLCPNGGDGTCRTCHQVLAAAHADVVVVERAGPFITVDQAHEITRMAARTPVEGRRKVLILVDFHLAEKAVPALLKTDPEVAARREMWASVPARLDSTGATVAALAADLLAMTQRAGADGLDARHRAERETSDIPPKELDERQRREQRRLRTDELRAGLATLAAAYRDRAVSATSVRAQAHALEAAGHVHAAAESLIRNPNEGLLLQALLVRLQPPGQ